MRLKRNVREMCGKREARRYLYDAARSSWLKLVRGNTARFLDHQTVAWNRLDRSTLHTDQIPINC